MAEPTNPNAIAIVGLAGRFPGARGLDEFWRNLRDGVESLETFSDADLDAAGVPMALRSNPHFVRKGTTLEEAEFFDAGFFGLSPRDAQILDPQHRIFLECAWEALEHAGYAGGARQEAVGVYAGASMNTYLLSQILRDPVLAESVGGYQLMLANDKDFLCTRVSYKLDLHGPSMTIQTACSTSLVAVAVACRALQRGECDLALAGGVSVSFPQRSGYLYQEGMILSPDGHCRPFDADAHGIRGGAGAGTVVLKRLADALADRDTIHAVILGAAVNNDGAGKAGYTAPSVDGQVEVVAMAQALAGVDPRTISYVETHGTGTPLGDPIEIAALTRVFRASTPDVGFCRIGSLKANIGHLDAAAGVAGLIKTVLALTHREIPPLVNFRTPNPQLNLELSPFTASAQGSAWAGDSTPRRAGVSSFGIGGTNAHVVLEEAPPTETVAPLRDAHLLVLSARTPTALEQATAQLADHLHAQSDLSLADVEWTLQAGRQGFSHRRAVVVRDTAQAITALRQPQRQPVLTGTHKGGARPVAFLFSGQGSQHAGMGAGLYRGERVYRAAVDHCATLLLPHIGVDIRTIIIADNGDAAINETRFTQPALFVTEYALASLWMRWGLTPQAMMGHSIGEYVAAHLAGVMSLEDALTVVATRGRLMQALPAGSMAAVQLGEGELGRRLNAGVEIAAVNAPSLCTVSGPAEAVAVLLAQLGAEGIESRALHTSHAFHSAMMEPALASFTDVLKGIVLAPPTIPYVSNVTGTWITPEQATSPVYYATHLRQAVRFEAGVRTLAADPALFFVEVGPGNALTSLARITVGKDGGRRVIPSLSHPREGRPDAEAILDAAARLWIAGAAVDWQGVHDGATVRRVPLPTYPFERRRHWVEPAMADRPVGDRPLPASRREPVRETEIRDWFWLPSWQRSVPLSTLQARAGSAQGRWLVFRDSSAASKALAERLSARGVTVISVLPAESYAELSPTQYCLAPDRRDDYARLLAAVLQPGEMLAGIAHLWNATPAGDGAQLKPDPQAGRTLGFYSLLCLAQVLADMGHPAPLPVLVISTDLASILGIETQRTERSLLLGPVYLMPQDVPFLRCRSIDLWSAEWRPDRALQIADCLLAEATKPDGEAVVAYRGGNRWLTQMSAVPLESPDDAELPLRQGGTYLITGGTGGIGLIVARYLARAFKARLVLTARSVLPERDLWDGLLADPGVAPTLKARLRGILALEALGGEVMVASADVSDEQQMSAVIASARARFGAIHGVMHAAGLLSAGTLREKTLKEIESVLRPKVEGTLVLDKLLAGAGLDVFVLFSSISTAVGSPGMTDYSSANAFLDAFATARVSLACKRVIAIGWDSWRDVGFAAGVASEHAALRMAIRPDEGIEALRRVLASGFAHAYVARRSIPDVIEGVETLLRWMRDPAEQPASARADRMSLDTSEAVRHARPSLETTHAEPQTREEQMLAAIWSELLGIDQIGVHDDFFALGGHSLMATRVLARIDDTFGVRLALRDVFDAPTIHSLSERIAAAAPGRTGAAQLPDDDREEIEI